jgi:hypothetical protein
MELVELLNQTRMFPDNTLRLGVKAFIFSKDFLPASPKLRMTKSTALVSMGYRGF